MNQPKRVAAIVTEYRKNSHADVIVGKILEGYDQKGGPGPDLKLVTMYVDQFPDSDMSRALAQKHGFKIVDSIADALTLGGPKLVVDGVLLIGEHGKYPFNEKGQHLYPRRRFFEETANTFAQCKQVVPAFNDKHLSATWADARWMYDRAQELFVPFMAGSSLPVTWRVPPLEFPRNAPLTDALALGYGGTESYGFHTLEVLQCMVERRKGGEVGVARVQYLPHNEMWKAVDEKRISQELLDAGLAALPTRAKTAGDYRELCARNPEAGAFLIDYRDGFKAAALLLNGYSLDGKSGGFAFAARLADQPKPVATHFHLQNEAPFGHFGHLVRGIERMIQTNHPAYSVERTLLTTGILDAIMTSRFEKGRALDTPHLNIGYQPLDWPPAQGSPPPPSA
jgi:hypothetical protein